MKKMTECDEQGNWCLRGMKWADFNACNLPESVRQAIYGALYKLHVYEKSELTPEQVLELQEDCSEWEREAKRQAAAGEFQIELAMLVEELQTRAETVRIQLEQEDDETRIAQTVLAWKMGLLREQANRIAAILRRTGT